MPYPYPTLGQNSSTNLYTIFKFVNDGISCAVMPSILGAIWFIAFIGSISEGRQASRGFIFASFVVSILAILLTLIGMLSRMYMYFSFILVGIGLIWHQLQNAPGI
jgi:phosphoglycerol transferase MdoB-like AlkP superfamily enzyme